MLHIILFSSRLLLPFIILFVGFASVAARLPDDELKSLSVIARTLGKKDWSLGGDIIDPCNGQPPPWSMNSTGQNGVICDTNCSLGSNNTCHVTEIYFKSENLNGSLPRELVGLPSLEIIDLSRNYLNSSIPPEWGSMKSLRMIFLLGNRLTGPIPKELASVTTLEELVLEANQFNGTIPSELGDLPRIKRLVLSSNNLTGELPSSLAKLTTLKEFRISGNNFSGSIPNFIQNWTTITRIEIQGSGLSGPIPSNLTSLTMLKDLRISDLNGSQESDFPKLYTSVEWDKLILRSCNIVGTLPELFENMKIEDVLDLSFNKLTGDIPPNLGTLEADIYLTGNSLNGTVPDSMKTKNSIDLSYNNLNTSQISEPNCGGNSPNLFANSKGSTNSDSFYCTTRRCEPNEYYSFHINCGSDQKVGDYEADGGGDGKFFQSTHWGFSRTGEFQNVADEHGYGTSFTRSLGNTESLSISDLEPPDNSNSISHLQLYQDARLSPLSLTYFGFCLRNGNYKVKLHFAEIMFANDTTYYSLGRRVFDIYIQGILEEKDFNIANAAGGVHKARTKDYVAVVTNNTLEIRFYWAGKGTTALPERSVYGPLISAISVVHADYRPENRLSAGAIVGIVMALLFAVVLVLGILWWKGFLWRKDSIHHDLKGLDLHTGSFTLRQIRAATNNFDPANKIGEGGFGPVFKGVLLDGTIIAVKQLSSKSKQGNREFVNEIGMISALQHPHLVKLYGCCIEGNQLLLVYEYMENNSLARALFGPEEEQLHLDWATRRRICIGIARGLAYLHEESRLKIVHRDIKATNVLLDRNLDPKISDFGLAKLDEEENTHISTRIAGTFGYMAPEYAMRGYLTDKADVYSFGIVLLEIISGRSNSSLRPKAETFYLLDWANSLKAKGKLIELVDPRLEMNFNKKEAIRGMNIALLCTNAVAAERPSMSAVVSMLEGRDGVEKLVTVESEWSNISLIEQVEEVVDDGISIDVHMPWNDSSTSADDIYPLALDTDNYWDERSQ